MQLVLHACFDKNIEQQEFLIFFDFYNQDKCLA